MSAAVLAILDSDLKAAQPALHKARQVADSTKAPLHVLVNAYSSAMVRAVGVDHERQDAARAQIHKAWQNRISELTDRERCQLSILWHKDSMAALRESILDLQPAMVVVHTSEESGLRRHLFTPRDWQLIRKAPCPVLCVHDRQWPSSPRILAALDPGTEEQPENALALNVLRAADHFASNLSGGLHAAHVLDEMDDSLILLVGEAIPDYSVGMDKVRQFYRDRFQAFATDHGRNVWPISFSSGISVGARSSHVSSSPSSLGSNICCVQDNTFGATARLVFDNFRGHRADVLDFDVQDGGIKILR